MLIAKVDVSLLCVCVTHGLNIPDHSPHPSLLWARIDYVLLDGGSFERIFGVFVYGVNMISEGVIFRRELDIVAYRGSVRCDGSVLRIFERFADRVGCVAFGCACAVCSSGLLVQ